MEAMNAICIRPNRLVFQLGTYELSRILLSVLCIVWSFCAQAGGIVTNCTEANLRAALAGGGTVTFACDGTITLTAQLLVTNDTIIDAKGHTVSLNGNASTRIFDMTPGVS